MLSEGRNGPAEQLFYWCLLCCEWARSAWDEFLLLTFSRRLLKYCIWLIPEVISKFRYFFLSTGCKVRLFSGKNSKNSYTHNEHPNPIFHFSCRLVDWSFRIEFSMSRVTYCDWYIFLQAVEYVEKSLRLSWDGNFCVILVRTLTIVWCLKMPSIKTFFTLIWVSDRFSASDNQKTLQRYHAWIAV